jgi:hypothetical protein
LKDNIRLYNKGLKTEVLKRITGHVANMTDMINAHKSLARESEDTMRKTHA